MHNYLALVLASLAVGRSLAKDSPHTHDDLLVKRSNPNVPTSYSYGGYQGHSGYAPESHESYRNPDPRHWSNRPEEYQNWSRELYEEHLQSIGQGSSRQSKSKGSRSRKMLDERAPAPSDPNRYRMTASEQGLQDAGLVLGGLGTAAVAGVWARDIMKERAERRRQREESETSTRGRQYSRAEVQLGEIGLASDEEDDEQRPLQKRSTPNHIDTWQGGSFYQAPMVHLPEVYGRNRYESPSISEEGLNSEIYGDIAYPDESIDEEDVVEQVAGDDEVEKVKSTRRRRRNGKDQVANRRLLRDNADQSEQIAQFDAAYDEQYGPGLDPQYGPGLDPQYGPGYGDGSVITGVIPSSAPDGADWNMVYGWDTAPPAPLSSRQKKVQKASEIGMYVSGSGMLAVAATKQYLKCKKAYQEHMRAEAEREGRQADPSSH